MVEDTQHSRHRARASRVGLVATDATPQGSSVPVKVEPMFIPLDECCKPVMVATFRRSVLAVLEYRHVGRKCVGQLDPINIPNWRRAKGLKP